ncbi:MAG TPA: outer membrane protein assembly factor BamD [Chitinivibrionales bacterium]|jgi:outer membrane protein assembly factor BamD|nr:outer membrane protein assembly factor BamD [Chitinivibrionales bacterium]
MNTLVRRVCFLFLIAAIAFSASAKPKKLYDCSGQLAKAVEKYNKKKYFDVTNILTEVLLQCPGHNAYDSMLYYQAKSLLALKKYAEAKTEFDRIVQTYPSSPFYEESYYLVGYAMFLSSPSVELDQASTKDAQSRLKDFVETYPKSPLADSAREYIAKADAKFAEKEFQAAKFYEQIEQYDAAVVYYKLLISEYPQCKFVPQALLGTAEDLIKTNRAAEAAAVLEDLSHQTKDEAILKKAQLLQSKVTAK